MAGEQEVNQRSIISQPAPGGKGASHATTPSPPLPCWDPRQPGNPSHRSALQRPCGPVCCVSLCQVTLVTQPRSANGSLRACVHAEAGRGKSSVFAIALCRHTSLVYFLFLLLRKRHYCPVWTGTVTTQGPPEEVFSFKLEHKQTRQYLNNIFTLKGLLTLQHEERRASLESEKTIFLWRMAAGLSLCLALSNSLRS